MLDKASVERICIDDFALKRRFRYGTIMINIETGRIIDIFESREPGDIAKWLETYPNIKVVSRDGSQQYAAAIKQAHPDAVQVSDRFHLVKNLTDAAKEHIKKAVSANFRISTTEGSGNREGGYWDDPERYDRPDLPERQHAESTEKKAIMIQQVRELAKQGFNVNKIARETGLSWNAAKRYLDEEFDPRDCRFGVSRPSKLDPYAEEIDAMLSSRRTFREIEDTIRQHGYTGAASTIRMYATRQRRRARETYEESNKNTELIERKWVIKLLYQPIEKIKGITEDQAERIVDEYPVIGEIYGIVRSFKEMMFAKRADDVDAWIETVSKIDIDEITGFINGITRDLDAVKNAIRFDYNNGLAEGSINKLKVIKRIMYGRCSFGLLRNKVLAKELSQAIN